MKIKHLTNRRKKIVLIILILLFILSLLFFTGIVDFTSQASSKLISADSISIPLPETKEFQDFHLLIPTLDISSPVIADVDGKNKDTYFKALEGGVAHYQNTAKPGENGNIFIFGHSSYYNWAKGDYKKVFRNLEDIKKGDEINLWWQKKEYKYTVTEIKVVKPTDVSVLKPTPNEQLTLMTCVPIGTAENRLIVVAKPKI